MILDLSSPDSINSKITLDRHGGGSGPSICRHRLRWLAVAARHRARRRPSGTAFRAVWIGVTATVAVALVTGLVVLLTSGGKSPASNQSRSNRSQSTSTDEFELVIRTVSFTTSAKGQMVTVAGVVHGLGGGQAVYAVAQPMTPAGSAVSSSSVQRWFVGGPATVRDDGGWITHLQVKPTVSALRVVAINAATPPDGTSCVLAQVQCITDSLAGGGPAGPFVVSRSLAIHATRNDS